jgi:hypothetical protein
VDAEIGGKINMQNAGVPPEYQTPGGTLVTSYGNMILQRHAGDPAAQAVLSESINDYKVQRQADELIPNFSSQASPKENLEALNRSLEGQPPEVVDRVMADPRVQKVIREAEDWVNEPYKGVSAQDAKYNSQAAYESSQRLADVAGLLPPKYATQFVGKCMPTIKKIMSLDTPSPFIHMSRVVEAMDDSPQAQELTDTIAKAYCKQFEAHDSQFVDPKVGIVTVTIREGESPTLALAVTRQLEADGNTDLAVDVVNAITSGAKDLQAQVNDAYGEYAELTQELNWLIVNSKGKLTPDQLQKAVDEYIAAQPPEWQSQLRAVEGKMVDSATALNETLGGLQNLPDSLKQAAPEAFQSVRAIFQDQHTGDAMAFAATKDPSVFSGAEGGSAAASWVELGQNGKDFVPAYMAGKLLPDLAQLDPNDPASVAQVNRQLDDLQDNGAKLLGIPQSEVDAAVNQIRGLVGTLQTSASPDQAIKAATQQLAQLNGMKFSNGAAGVMFRTVAFALTGGALINATGKTLDDPSFKNVLGGLAFAAGLAPDAASFGTAVKLIDPNSKVGQFGLGTSKLGATTASFVAVLNIASFVYNGLEASYQGNVPLVLFNIAGAGGNMLAAFGTTPWAGPVGTAIVVGALAALEFTDYVQQRHDHTEAAEKFLQSAGLSPELAETLSDSALESATVLQDQLDLTPEQLQQITTKYPGILESAGHAEAIADVAQACGIKGEDVPGFIDALAKDDPEFVQHFYGMRADDSGYNPLTHQARLFDTAMGSMPTAANYVRQHSPELVGPEANARRQADRDYEAAVEGDLLNIGPLLAKHDDPVYEAEIIQLMKDSGTLDAFVREVDPGHRAATKSAIQAAEKAGVLTHEQAQRYLEQLG